MLLIFYPFVVYSRLVQMYYVVLSIRAVWEARMTQKPLLLAAIISLIISAPALAKNPLVKPGTAASPALSDQDLDKVRGTGQNADLYGYWGLYYASLAVQNGAL